ncbi:MAG: hypothetical protein GC168_10035 [Candidatus Hydrogenedens sp.]|nr:hypothetical protein [Candidatus Hydrogenedens sp.]
MDNAPRSSSKWPSDGPKAGQKFQMAEETGLEPNPLPLMDLYNSGQSPDTTGQMPLNDGHDYDTAPRPPESNRTGGGQVEHHHRKTAEHNICTTALGAVESGLHDHDGTLAQLHELWPTLTPEARRLIVQVAESMK